MISWTSRRSPRSGVLGDHDVVLTAKEANLAKLAQVHELRADAVVDVVVVVGNFVREVGDLGFEAGLLALDEPFAELA